MSIPVPGTGRDRSRRDRRARSRLPEADLDRPPLDAHRAVAREDASFIERAASAGFAGRPAERCRRDPLNVRVTAAATGSTSDSADAPLPEPDPSCFPRHRPVSCGIRRRPRLRVPPQRFIRPISTVSASRSGLRFAKPTVPRRRSRRLPCEPRPAPASPSSSPWRERARHRASAATASIPEGGGNAAEAVRGPANAGGHPRQARTAARSGSRRGARGREADRPRRSRRCRPHPRLACARRTAGGGLPATTSRPGGATPSGLRAPRFGSSRSGPGTDRAPTRRRHR